MEDLVCGSCGAPVDGAIGACGFCGKSISRMDLESEPLADVPLLSAWLQGMTPDGRPNGSYETIDLGLISLQDTTRILDQMKLPVDPVDPNDICPPVLGFGERNLSWADGEFCFFDLISDPEIHMLVTDPSSILAEIYRTENGQLDVARLEVSYPGISMTAGTAMTAGLPPSGTPWSRLFRPSSWWGDLTGDEPNLGSWNPLIWIFLVPITAIIVVITTKLN